MVKGKMILEKISEFLAEINNVDEHIIKIDRDEYYTDDDIYIIIELLEDLGRELQIAIDSLRSLYYGE
ncbi:hypothetical protein [Campylobacter hyointestinalis]|uniref:hypothetical protein n=1 Tax=Campylobacter hyointestinalis TaxID=198 RepID=UPI000DCC5CEE|nr:hypothetical protein [Campylobacter hyointestinalis]RAZ59610.1 hypothetical protein CHL10071_08940 [Campylobacter hyointestinalis subsp. lawsonii]